MKFSSLGGLVLVAGLAACGGGGGSDASPVAVPEMRARKAIELAFAAEPVQRVNTSLAGDQQLQSLGALADGGHALVWRSGASDWVMRRFDAQGTPASGEAPLGLGPLPDSGHAGASAAVLAGGQVVIAYVDARELPQPPAPPLLEMSVSLQRFDASGAPLQAQAPAASMTFVPHSRSPAFGSVRALALSDGGFVVAWGLVSPSSVTVRYTFSAQRFDAAGQPTGEPVPLGKPATPGEASYRLWADAAGGFTAAVYQLDESYQPDHSLLHVTPQGTQQIAPVGGNALLLALQGGRLVRFDQDGAGAYLQLLEPGGVAGTRTPLPGPATAARELADGRFAAAWAEGASLRAQVFGSDGRPEARPLHSAAGAGLEMAARADGGFVLAWSAAAPGAGLDVLAQRFAEGPAKKNAARLAQWKSCLASVRGMKGQARKRMLDDCMQE